MCVSSFFEVHVTVKDACKAKAEGTFMVIICALDLVSRVKELVAETLSVEELPDGHVAFRGKVLDDDEELSAYGITNGAALDFVFGSPQVLGSVRRFGRNPSRLESIDEEVDVNKDQNIQDLEELVTSIRKLRDIEQMVDKIDHHFTTPPVSDADSIDRDVCDDTKPRLLVDTSGQPWLKKESRSNPGKFYWANPVTGKTVWKRPQF
jgi:uncharacterized ubiquitin-like protein YukD